MSIRLDRYIPKPARGHQWDSTPIPEIVVDLDRFAVVALAEGLARVPVRSLATWAQENVRLPGSARSERYDPLVTPWTTPVLEAVLEDTVRTVTFIKPVQSGGSTVGEIALCHWLANSSGDCLNVWSTDGAASDRWTKRLHRILKACPPLADIWPTEKGTHLKGLVAFPTGNLTVLGAWQEDNLDSDSVRYLLNEEVHAWAPGRLPKAYARTTAYWNAKIVNISNAGVEGDQLHAAWRDGTMEEWEVPCPGCGEFHAMRSHYDVKHPEKGGLRYDSDGTHKDTDEDDFRRIAPTIRYHWPCGHESPDDLALRRKLSLEGRYRVTNPGAIGHRSFNLSATAVDYIPWLVIVKEKRLALRAMQRGDPEPYRRFVQERDCKFWKPEDRPLVVAEVVISPGRRKSRAGLVDRAVRLAAIDVQRGQLLTMGETPHYWMVVRDFDLKGNSLLVYEARVETQGDLQGILKEHGVEPRHVVVDSGDAATTLQVYSMCLQMGWHAIKGGNQEVYRHRDGSIRIFAEEQPLHRMAGIDPVRADSPVNEPQFVIYSRIGIRERLAWVRSNQSALKWEVPADVSETYLAHMASEERRERLHPRTNEPVVEWIRTHRRNDLFACECMIILLAEMAGLIGAGAPAILEGADPDREPTPLATA